MVHVSIVSDLSDHVSDSSPVNISSSHLKLPMQLAVEVKLGAHDAFCTRTPSTTIVPLISSLMIAETRIFASDVTEVVELIDATPKPILNPSTVTLELLATVASASLTRFASDVTLEVSDGVAEPKPMRIPALVTLDVIASDVSPNAILRADDVTELVRVDKASPRATRLAETVTDDVKVTLALAGLTITASACVTDEVSDDAVTPSKTSG